MTVLTIVASVDDDAGKPRHHNRYTEAVGVRLVNFDCQADRYLDILI
jgi:hypothetical protein